MFRVTTSERDFLTFTVSDSQKKVARGNFQDVPVSSQVIARVVEFVSS